MEIEVTWIEEDAHLYSGSRAELGQNSAHITWNNAMSAKWPKGRPFYTNEEEVSDEDISSYMIECGMDKKEIKSMPTKELHALLVQEAASLIRQHESDDQAGVLTEGDDGELYFYLGI